MPDLKPAYLIHGDDHGAVAERRARLRALAEAGGDAGSVEFLEGEQGTPGGVAQALCAMTFAMGRRVLIVDGVERWKQAEVEAQLAPAMKEMPPDTTVALFAREEGRAKAPAALHKAVEKAGGQVVAESTVKPWELPRWAREQAARMGLTLDTAAAKSLVAQVGERQQRLLRELEKLALEMDSADGGESAGAGMRTGASGGARVSVEDVEARAAQSATTRVWGLADALVAGDAARTLRDYLSLRRQGERLPGLTFVMAGRLREALAVSLRLAEGESVAEVRRGLRMPPRAAERFVADVARTDPERLRGALEALADLELDTRGGALVNAHRSRLSGLQEDTLALRAIQAATT
jgi:DNA polymerase-3 subunit delta